MDPTQVPAGSIVIGIDGSPSSQAALVWAADQAALEQRQLTIVHVMEPIRFAGGGFVAGTGVDYGQILADEQDYARVLLTDASELALRHHPQLTVNGVVSLLDPRSVLLDLAESATMIVVGSRGRGPVSSLLLGSVSVSVSKHAACPVVVHRTDTTGVARRGILVGIDGSEHSQPAIEFAFRMASWRALPLTVLHCYWGTTPVGSSLTETGGTALPPDDDEQALVAESLAGMQEKFPEVHVDLHVSHDVADRLLVAASRDHDLVVIGHRPISVIDDLVFGSLAPVIVEHAHGPVAVVPSREPLADTGSE